jgi:hypothetical protein
MQRCGPPPPRMQRCGTSTPANATLRDLHPRECDFASLSGGGCLRLRYRMSHSRARASEFVRECDFLGTGGRSEGSCVLHRMKDGGVIHSLGRAPPWPGSGHDDLSMPPLRPVPEPLRYGPFGVQQGLDWVSRKQLQGPAYDRLTRGAYTAAGGERSHPELIMAMRTVLPPGAVLSGLSAAWTHGVAVARPEDPIEVILPPNHRVRHRRGLTVRVDILNPDEIVHTPFGLATSGTRTAFDLGRLAKVLPAESEALLRQIATRQMFGQLPSQAGAQLCETVSLVDAVLRKTGESVEAVSELVRRHRGVRGLKALRVALALADPRAESFPESVVRARIMLAGLPWPVPQYQVLGPHGEFVARVDLAWPELRLAAEYDGQYHLEAQQILDDRDRDNRLLLAHWRMIHLDRAHLSAPDYLVQTIRAAIKL